MERGTVGLLHLYLRTWNDPALNIGDHTTQTCLLPARRMAKENETCNQKTKD
jgi:hypothetical protein